MFTYERIRLPSSSSFFFFNDTATTEIYTLSLHDALPISICLSVAGGMWASTYGMRSDIRNIMTRMDSASEALKLSVSLAEERAAALKDSIDSIKRRQELQQYEIQSLKEMILKGAQR